MNFAKFNKERLFTVDTSDYDYVSLEDLWKKNPNQEVKYTLQGVYISTKSDYNDESPMAAIEGTYVNLPQHQLSEIKAMLADRRAIEAINSGEAAFTIRPYEQKRYHKTCFSACWCDADLDSIED